MILSNPKNGWATFSLGQFESSISYLTDVPFDCLTNLRLSLKHNIDFEVIFDTEEKGDITLIISNGYCRIDFNGNQYMTEIDIKDFALQICKDIEYDLVNWSEWWYLSETHKAIRLKQLTKLINEIRNLS